MVVDQKYQPVYCHSPESVKRWLKNQNVKKIKNHKVRIWKNGSHQYLSIREYLGL